MTADGPIVRRVTPRIVTTGFDGPHQRHDSLLGHQARRRHDTKFASAITPASTARTSAKTPVMIDRLDCPCPVSICPYPMNDGMITGSIVTAESTVTDNVLASLAVRVGIILLDDDMESLSRG